MDDENVDVVVAVVDDVAGLEEELEEVVGEELHPSGPPQRL